MRMKEESEKAGLKLKDQAPSPITSWQIDREKAETVTDFIFLCSEITVDRDCSHEVKRHLLLERKVMTNPDKVIKKQRHCFADKGPYVKVMVLPVVMSGCGEGNGNPLQYSCLENPMDGGAW